jgi:hypothetical protein
MWAYSEDNHVPACRPTGSDARHPSKHLRSNFANSRKDLPKFLRVVWHLAWQVFRSLREAQSFDGRAF